MFNIQLSKYLSHLCAYIAQSIVKLASNFSFIYFFFELLNTSIYLIELGLEFTIRSDTFISTYCRIYASKKTRN